MNTHESIENILKYWSDYQNDMRPETRNAFLRVFKEKAQALTYTIEIMKRSEWQPIESAPKDGTKIITTCVDRYPRDLFCDKYFQNEKRWSCGGKPTHWMPLPPAPEKYGE